MSSRDKRKSYNTMKKPVMTGQRARANTPKSSASTQRSSSVQNIQQVIIPPPRVNNSGNQEQPKPLTREEQADIWKGFRTNTPKSSTTDQRSSSTQNVPPVITPPTRVNNSGNQDHPKPLTREEQADIWKGFLTNTPKSSTSDRRSSSAQNIQQVIAPPPRVNNSGNQHQQESPVNQVIDLINQRHQQTGEPVSLRWEAEGDARHSAMVLSELQKRNIPFRAQIHHFEDEGHTNVEKAQENLQSVFANLDQNGSTVEMRTGQDVTRGGSGSKSQDFIFIRNLVGTDEDTKTSSDTRFRPVLNMHRDAMRQRRNSLTFGGEMLVGGSGFPFVEHQSGNHDFMDLSSFAPVVGMHKQGELSDQAGVMKDDGKTLTGLGGTKKTTYYHRFAPIPDPRRPGSKGSDD